MFTALISLSSIHVIDSVTYFAILIISLWWFFAIPWRIWIVIELLYKINKNLERIASESVIEAKMILSPQNNEKN